MTTVRTLIACVVKKGWGMFQLHVNNVFLHGDLHEEVYMKIPSGLEVPNTGLVCKLNKSLYGLKQASRQWYAKLTEASSSRGYSHSHYDHSLFYRKDGSLVVFVAVYADNVVLIGTNTTEITQLKVYLDNTFKIKDLGRLHYFLSLEILDTTVLISQRKFILDLLKEYEATIIHLCLPL